MHPVIIPKQNPANLSICLITGILVVVLSITGNNFTISLTNNKTIIKETINSIIS